MAVHILNIVNNLIVLIRIGPQNSIILSQIIGNLVLKIHILLKSAIFLMQLFGIALESIAILSILVQSFFAWH